MTNTFWANVLQSVFFVPWLMCREVCVILKSLNAEVMQTDENMNAKKKMFILSTILSSGGTATPIAPRVVLCAIVLQNGILAVKCAKSEQN